MKKMLIGLLVGLALLSSQGPASAAPVGLELLLLVDVSGSVDDYEYALQKQGYVQAFQNATIQANIASITGGIAVAYGEWSGAGQQSLEVSWYHITDAASANAFAALIGGATRDFGGLTAPGNAINWGAGLFTDNGYEGSRLVIDVSGDGIANDGDSTVNAATNANTAGFTINGLPIGDAGLQAWYAANIVTPGGGFLEVAAGFTDFADAVTRKIGREINPVPEPATLLLLGIGLIGLARYGRKN